MTSSCMLMLLHELFSKCTNFLGKLAEFLLLLSYFVEHIELHKMITKKATL